MTNRRLPLAGLIVTLFFLSGATGLIYEIVWTRFFTIAYGNTTYGVSAVLTAFMAGLGLGSYVFGRVIDRKKDYLLIYALLEIGIALIALAMPQILDLLQGVYARIYGEFPSSIWLLQSVRTLLSFIILVIPTFLMGATLPVLTRFFVSHKSQIGSRVGVLYGANTLGATIGSFITGFFLIQAFGLRQTVYIAASVNLILAAIFLLVRQRLDSKSVLELTGSKPATNQDSDVHGDELSPRQIKILLICFAVAGFCSLAYEVLWFRLLVFHLQTTIYAFTTMLTTFLVGIGLGSVVSSAFLRKGSTINKSWMMFFYIEAAIGVLGLLSIWLFGSLGMLNTFLVDPFWKYVAVQFSAAAIIMMLPALLMGAAFPVVCRIVSNDAGKIGGTVGLVYAANTVGAIFGSFVTGFYLVRHFGTQDSLILIAMLNVMVAAMVLFYAPRNTHSAAATGVFKNVPNLALVMVLWVIVISITLLIPRNYIFEYYNVREKLHNPKVTILHAEEGLESVTTVHQYPDGSRTISAGSINVAGTAFTHRTTQILQAHVPMLLHPDAREVVQIGFGSGETAHILTTYDNVERVDLVDISKSVLDTSAQFFKDINFDVVKHPKFHPYIMDGANYLRLTGKKYDVIMNDSIWPFYAGNSGLYTKDYFEAGRRHLKEGGFMTSWLPLQIDPEDFKILLNTFHSVFPHVSVWVAMTHYNKHALIVGSEKKIEIDMPRFVERYNRFARKDMQIIDIDSPIQLLNTFLMDEKTFGDEIDSAAIHTEDNPVLEFSLSRGNTANVQMRVYDFMRSRLSNVSPYLINLQTRQRDDVVATLAAASQATAYVMTGFVKQDSFQPDYVSAFEAALKSWPQHAGAQRALYLARKVATTKLDVRNLAGKSFEELSQVGEQLLRNNAYDQAYLVYEKLRDMRPNNAAIHETTGVILYHLGRFSESIAAFEKAISINSTPELLVKLSMSRNQYGLQLATQGLFDKAEQHFIEAIKLNPDFSEAHSNYGILLANIGQIDRAIQQQERALSINPRYATAQFRLGMILGRNGRTTDALKYLKAAIAIEPGLWPAYEELAITYFNIREYKKSWDIVHRIQDANKPINASFLSALKARMPDPRG